MVFLNAGRLKGIPTGTNQRCRILTQFVPESQTEKRDGWRSVRPFLQEV